MKPRLIKRIEELTEANREIENRIRELEGLTCTHTLSDMDFDMLRQMLSMFRTGIDWMSVEEKRAAIRTLVRKVVWDGVNAHVVLFGANEDEIEFPDMKDRIGCLDGEAGEEDGLEDFGDVNYDEVEEENAAADSKSPWGEDSK